MGTKYNLNTFLVSIIIKADKNTLHQSHIDLNDIWVIIINYCFVFWLFTGISCWFTQNNGVIFIKLIWDYLF